MHCAGEAMLKETSGSCFLKVCSVLGNVIEVGIGGGRQKGLKRIYNIICIICLCLPPLSHIMVGVGG